MSPLVAVFLLLSGLALLLLPRRLAALPMIVATCYMTRVGVDLGAFTFTVLRILVCLGLARVLIRGERVGGGVNGVDRWMLAWGAWLVISVFFHRDASTQLITRLGMALDGLGLYFLFRIFCRSRDEILGICRMLVVVLIPLAAEMIVEKATAYNAFSVLGGVPALPVIRNGAVRAQGPFDVSILAGTVGAGALLLTIGLWRFSRTAALIGMAASVGMIYASTSSGPILTAAWGIAAILLWPYRGGLWRFRWAAVCMYLALVVVMQDPPYFLLARIDLTGSSTGWHRARLIESAIEHLSEWWLFGTDYTFHWMPYGLGTSADHTDITNHYLIMGVLGGLPLMFLFVAMLVQAFSLIGMGLHDRSESAGDYQFAVWTVGATLFAHTITFVSVSYYDQSAAFFYLPLAMAGCVNSPIVVTGTVEGATLGSRPIDVTRLVADRKTTPPAAVARSAGAAWRQAGNTS